MNLYEWAIKWQIPIDAIDDLKREFNMIDTDPTYVSGGSEAAIQTQIRLEATIKGARLFRNNVGGTHTDHNSFIRYGLANDTEQLNKVLKSSDLIGIQPVKILQTHVGQVIGQFVAREVKREGWEYTGDKREQAQLNFLQLIASMGGNACFATGEGTL